MSYDAEAEVKANSPASGAVVTPDSQSPKAPANAVTAQEQAQAIAEFKRQVRGLQGNSKKQLARAVVSLRGALAWYAREANWAVSGEDIVWVGDDDPLKIAEIVLGKRKG